MEITGDIRFEVRGRAGVVTLARPHALNALTHDMLLRLEAQLKAWEDYPAVSHVVVRAEGRAFCAGGDLMALYEARHDGLSQRPFFADEYRINAYVGRYPKPYIALIDGIDMGGGVGISVHGRYRVATEHAIFAMPEVGIGFFPDVGGSHFLPRLPGHFGLYLGLTGNRIRWGDMRACGIATHTVPAQRLDALAAALESADDAGAVLATFDTPVDPETSAHDFQTIVRVFSAGSVSAILDALSFRASADAFADKLQHVMLTKSPTSLCVAFRQIGDGAGRTMAQCMAMEYRIVSRMLTGHDFFEGIRTVLVDKGDRPVWKPASVADVDPSAVDAYFQPVESGELVL